MPRVKCYLYGDGRIAILRSPGAAALTEQLAMTASVRRLSHIEPCQWFLRLCFRILRFFSDPESLLAAWTRTWPCRWRVDFRPIGGGIFCQNLQGQPFSSRQAAVEFEIELAQKFLKDGSIPMLVLSRAESERIVVLPKDGSAPIVITIVRTGPKTRVGIEAEPGVIILRHELYEAQQQQAVQSLPANTTQPGVQP